MIKVATDFSGLGSPEEALKVLEVKHRIVFACDKDKYAKASYLANHDPEIFYDDITTRDQATAPESDMYFFGFPWQAFSIAGKQLGFEDARGTLFFNSLSYLKEKQPRVFICENVKGLLSHDKQKGSKSKYGKTFGVIRDALGITVNGQQNLYKYKDCLNYHIYFQVLNSKHYGIPQNRERIFIIGFRDEVNFKFPKPFPLKLRLKDLLEDNVDEKYYISDAAISRIIRKGYSLPKINPDISGTLNTKNNSGQLSIDSGTTLIISDRGNKGEYIVTKDIVGALSSRAGCSHDNHIISTGFISQDTQASQIYSEDGLFPAVCAGSHGYAMGYVEINENTRNCTNNLELYDSLNYSNPNSETRRGRIGRQIAQTIDTGCQQAVLIPLYGSETSAQSLRIYDDAGLSCTISSQGGGMGAKTGLYQIKSKIRRLTPLEVFRLFGFADEFFYKCQVLNSDTQLYKQGGNSIVKDTLMYILIEVCKSLDIPFKIPAA